MISWLKGKKIDTWQNGIRSGVTIACSGIGYDVQVLKRHLITINTEPESILWIHQVQKDDGSFLIGFVDKKDRDFFRKLISVNGIGPQLAISLLEKNQAQDIIRAINEKDISQLTSCSGIGKRTAERLIIELKNKLPNLKQANPCNASDINKPQSFNTQITNEVKSALINLEYKNSEINQAFQELEISYKSSLAHIEGRNQVLENLDFQSLLKEALHIINK